ncbi:hypothetical protein CKAH01_09873 [Colletotrichum kahawae]|uniref:Uncharacterized protein n=1 Tax=Colletotrichum kahawae TaxID=34407 RepID=A0AAD9XXD5_COLKA|nr:hypothetical protein CKAH01_09873 [Colletotrichum kahawae]
MSIAITVLFHNEKDFQHDGKFYVNKDTPYKQHNRQGTEAAAAPHADFGHGVDGYAPLVTFGSSANLDNRDQIMSVSTGLGIAGGDLQAASPSSRSSSSVR